MPQRHLIRRLFLPYIIITLVSILAAVWFITRTVRSEYLNFHSNLLKTQITSIKNHIMSNSGDCLSLVDMSPHCGELGSLFSLEIILIDTTGKIICATDNEALYDFQINSPEVQSVFAPRAAGGDIQNGSDRVFISTRYSRRMKQDMIYAAASVEIKSLENRIILRVSSSIEPIQAILRKLYIEIAGIGLIVILAVGLVSWLVSKKLSVPFKEMTRTAGRYSRGDLDARMPLTGIVEFDDFAGSINDMAAKLKEKIEAVTRQSGEREAILSSMAEGVIAIDRDDKIMGINSAAAAMLNCEKIDVGGKTIQEVIRNVELQRFISGALLAPAPPEEEIILIGKFDRFVKARGTKLINSKNESIGALVVLNDITTLRRLENVRREFVSNVSHELRTPITSIKGFIETLREGAADNPEDARKFLGIISKQADRLNAIIEDLLSLSRIEQNAEKFQIELKNDSISQIIREAIADCGEKARAKKVDLIFNSAADYFVPVNSALLRQAIGNLLDNAIKYNPSGSRVTIVLQAAGGEIIIAVEDKGIGIEKEHLPRIFERFYRVDAARSRELGGTGLGLAIVKHIALAHQGRVTVESDPGKGSVFRIHLPEK